MRKQLIAGSAFILATAVLVACQQSSPTAPRATSSANGLASFSGSQQSKSDVCHMHGDGTFELINIADPALDSHLAHGDHVPLTFWQDGDGDGYGAGVAETGCVVPSGYVENDGDCDDSDGSVNPGAAEVCGDNVDNNCNGQIDEGCSVARCPCAVVHISTLGIGGGRVPPCTENGDQLTLGTASLGVPHATSTTTEGATSCAWSSGLSTNSSTGHSVEEAQACHDEIRAYADSLGAVCSSSS